MADAVAPNGPNPAGDEPAYERSNPPTDPDKFPVWAMAQSLGGIMAEGFLEDPEWVDAMNKAGLDEEQFADFWGDFMNMMLEDLNGAAEVLEELNDEDEEKSPVTAALS